MALIDQERLHRALNPRTLAVVGDKGPQYQWLTNQKDFTGELYSVQLDENEIPGIEEKGITNYKSLKDIPGDIDLVICAVPRQVTPFVVADAIEKGVGGISMFTSGSWSRCARRPVCRWWAPTAWVSTTDIWRSSSVVGLSTAMVVTSR